MPPLPKPCLIKRLSRKMTLNFCMKSRRRSLETRWVQQGFFSLKDLIICQKTPQVTVHSSCDCLLLEIFLRTIRCVSANHLSIIEWLVNISRWRRRRKSQYSLSRNLCRMGLCRMCLWWVSRIIQVLGLTILDDKLVKSDRSATFPTEANYDWYEVLPWLWIEPSRFIKLARANALNKVLHNNRWLPTPFLPVLASVLLVWFDCITLSHFPCFSTGSRWLRRWCRDQRLSSHLLRLNLSQPLPRRRSGASQWIGQWRNCWKRLNRLPSPELTSKVW